MDKHSAMSSNTSSDQPTVQPQAKPPRLASADLLLSLATAPVLIGLVASKVIAETIRQAGVFSEEVFRGDRLPSLTFPTSADPHPDDSDSV